MMQLIDRAKELQAEIGADLARAYSALQQANIRLGDCLDIALATPVDDTLRIGYRSVMGVEIPIVTASDFEAKLSYGFFGTDSSLDQTLYEFYRVKKAQKRANALKNIIIPRYTADIDYIIGVLEEREREEFSRLKVVKARK